MTDCRLCPAGTVALHLASALVPEADGNRTHQRRGTRMDDVFGDPDESRGTKSGAESPASANDLDRSR